MVWSGFRRFNCNVICDTGPWRMEGNVLFIKFDACPLNLSYTLFSMWPNSIKVLSAIFVLVWWFFRSISANQEFLGFFSICWIQEYLSGTLKIFIWRFHILAVRINEHMPTFMHVLNRNSSTNTWIPSAPSNNVLLIRRNSKRTLHSIIRQLKCFI